jgi:chaperone protein EcpD
MWKFAGSAGAALLACSLFASSVQANVLIGGTRVVFPAKENEVTVRLTSQNTMPVLIQAWIDRGDPQSSPDKAEAPFLISPPLFRMDAKKEQNLRIVFTQEPLPADRESLFWLNVLEVPPQAVGVAQDENLLQIALRSRLKLFYRPAALVGEPEKAPSQLTWKVVPDGQGYAVEIHNPTPYHISFSKLTLDVAGQPHTVDEAGVSMIAPMSNLRLSAPGLAQAPAGTPINFSVINDYGGNSDFTAVTLP